MKLKVLYLRIVTQESDGTLPLGEQIEFSEFLDTWEKIDDLFMDYLNDRFKDHPEPTPVEPRDEP